MNGIRAVISLFFVSSMAWASGQNFFTLESWGNGAPELRIAVPSGYTITKQKGPDFDVHYINPENTNDPSMGIYIGHHPNAFHLHQEGIKIRKETDDILGQKVEWILWQEKEDGKTIYRCETIIQGAFKERKGGGVAALMVHVFVRGSDRKQFNLLKNSAKSLVIHK